MADDIFLSSEEQDERAKKWLKDNGLSIAVGIGLGLAAVTGYNHYKDNLQAKAEQASALYGAALEQIGDSNLSDIGAYVSELKEKYSDTSYASKAVLLQSKQLAVSDLEAAITQLKWVAANAPEVGLLHTAKIRLAKIQIAQGDLEAAKAIASSVDEYNGFESHYQEILAEVSVKQGDFAAAREHYQSAIDSLQAGDSGYAQVLSIKLDRLPVALSSTQATPVETGEKAE
ncbi:MAG: putative negative regulator of RcsB-dependent stress response [Cryomorphaceae bacterium]|jgi:predicted negative regulator of RcsB-dependent stress response